MKGFLLILIFVVALLYIISPIDVLPDVIPIIGWLDDAFLVGLLIYYLRYGRLPGFLSGIENLLFKKGQRGRPSRSESAGKQEYGHSGYGGSKKDTPRNPHEVLGIEPSASMKEIQTAYREAVQKYHPDKVSHLGEEFQEMAQKRFVEIQDAYDALTGKTAKS